MKRVGTASVWKPDQCKGQLGRIQRVLLFIGAAAAMLMLGASQTLAVEYSAKYICGGEHLVGVQSITDGKEYAGEFSAKEIFFSIYYHEGKTSQGQTSITLPFIEIEEDGKTSHPWESQRCNDRALDIFSSWFNRAIPDSEVAEARRHVIAMCSSEMHRSDRFSLFGDTVFGWLFAPPIEGKPRSLTYKHSFLLKSTLETGSCLRVE